MLFDLKRLFFINNFCASQWSSPKRKHVVPSFQSTRRSEVGAAEPCSWVAPQVWHLISQELKLFRVTTQSHTVLSFLSDLKGLFLSHISQACAIEPQTELDSFIRRKKKKSLTATRIITTLLQQKYLPELRLHQIFCFNLDSSRFPL